MEKIILLLVVFTAEAKAEEKLFKLLVNAPSGKQEIIEVYQSGSYFDPSRVICDERLGCEIPKDAVLGAMRKSGGRLVVDESMKQAVEAREAQAVKEAEQKKADKEALQLIRAELVSKLKLGVATDEEVQQFLSLDL